MSRIVRFWGHDSFVPFKLLARKGRMFQAIERAWTPGGWLVTYEYVSDEV